jgi:hypothetical protein
MAIDEERAFTVAMIAARNAGADAVYRSPGKNRVDGAPLHTYLALWRIVPV